MRRFQFRWIGRRDPHWPVFRVATLCWGRAAGSGGFRRRLSLSLRPKLWFWFVGGDEWFLTLLGVRLHLKRSDHGGLV